VCKANIGLWNACGKQRLNCGIAVEIKVKLWNAKVKRVECQCWAVDLLWKAKVRRVESQC